MANKRKPNPPSPTRIQVPITGIDKSPEFYSDQFAAALNPWGAILVFAKQTMQLTPDTNRPAPSEAQVSIRMGLQHAKAMTMVLKRALKQWEQDNTEIVLAPSAYKALELSPKDW